MSFIIPVIHFVGTVEGQTIWLSCTDLCLRNTVSVSCEELLKSTKEAQSKHFALPVVQFHHMLNMPIRLLD